MLQPRICITACCLSQNDKYPLDDYSALGLVEFNIICHYNKYGNEIYDQVKERSDSKEVITIEDDMIFEC